MTAETDSHHVEIEQKVGSLELFFDLVFVFAITQVTSLLAADLTALGVLRGMMVLAEIWWAWVAYSWLTNALDTERSNVRLVLFAAMGAILVASLAVPHAFDEAALAFAVSIVIVRVLHLVVFRFGVADPGVHGAVLRISPGILLACVLLVASALTSGTTRLALFGAAIVFDYTAPLAGGIRGWSLSPAHFVERHGLIFLIAIGESIVSIGVGAEGHPVEPALLFGAALGLAAACALFWLYFDVVVKEAEKALHRARGDERNLLARNAFSYLHLPMVGGVVVFALGVKSALAHLHDPLGVVPALALGGGPAAFLAAHGLFRRMVVGASGLGRPVFAVACVGVALLAMLVPSYMGLGALALVLGALVVAESVRYARERRTA